MKNFLVTAFILIICGCQNQEEKLTTLCIEQLQSDLDFEFVDPAGYCNCAIPAVKEFTDEHNIDLLEVLEEKQFYSLIEKHTKLKEVTSNCGKLNPPKNLNKIVSISKKLRESLLRKYSTPLIGTDFENNHNIDSYCNCLIDQIDSNISVGEFIDPQWYKSNEFRTIDSTCQLISKNN